MLCRRLPSILLLAAAVVHVASTSWASSQQFTEEMEPLQDPLGDQRARLQNVADLLLEIYGTLAEMQYLNPAGIEAGPHDVNHPQPLFENHKLDPAVVYLYNILPYINRKIAGQSDFYQSGKFADFRSAENLEWSRNPYQAVIKDGASKDEEDGPYMEPWYTPLSFLGNHYTMLMYDAREHRIWILGYFWTGSADPVLEDIPVHPGKNRNNFGYVPNRPAEEVLRDINRRYRELKEIPGGDDAEGIWDREVTVASTYRKNGRPDHFDAESFRTDQYRGYAAAQAKYSAGQPLREVEKFQDWSSNSRRKRERLLKEVESAPTTDDMWIAKFDLLKNDKGLAGTLEDLEEAKQEAAILCPDGVCQNEEDLPLWEYEYLRREVEGQKDNIMFYNRVANQCRDANDPAGEQRFRSMAKDQEQTLPDYRMAFEASKVDMERLCPGRTPQSVLAIAEENSPEILRTIKCDKRFLLNRERRLLGIAEWMQNNQLPSDATKTKAAIEREVQEMEQQVKELKEKVQDAEAQWEKEQSLNDL